MSEERKTLRLDGDGRDVTDLPGLWDESDSIWHAPLVWSSERPCSAEDDERIRGVAKGGAGDE